MDAGLAQVFAWLAARTTMIRRNPSAKLANL